MEKRKRIHGGSFMDRVNARQPEAHGDCLLWAGSINDYGYGRVKLRVDGRKVERGVHRIVFENAYGPIPEGAQIDHICHNEASWRGECAGGTDCPHRRCYNVEHLRVATASENTRGSAIKMSRPRDNQGRFA